MKSSWKTITRTQFPSQERSSYADAQQDMEDGRENLMVDVSPLAHRGRPLARRARIFVTEDTRSSSSSASEVEVSRNNAPVNHDANRAELENANSFMRTLFAHMTPSDVAAFNERQDQIRVLLTGDRTDVSTNVFNDQTHAISMHMDVPQPASVELPPHSHQCHSWSVGGSEVNNVSTSTDCC